MKQKDLLATYKPRASEGVYKSRDCFKMAASSRSSSPSVQSEVEVKKEFALMPRFSEVPKDLNLKDVPTSCLRNDSTFPNRYVGNRQ